MSGVLYAVLGSTVQERDGATGENLMNSPKGDGGTGRNGNDQPGEDHGRFLFMDVNT